jgi:Spy/CpxP family protein refolding chaperone
MRLHQVRILCLVILFVALPTALLAQATPQPVGSVTGVVKLPDGTPAANLRVSAVRAEGIDAVKAMASLAQTDAAGRYRLESIPPGRYYISAGNVDFQTYYPGTLIPGQGTVVSITSATTVADINFSVQEPSLRPGANPRGFGVRGQGPANGVGPGLALPPPPPLPPGLNGGAALRGSRVALNNLSATLNQLTSSLQASRGAWWTNQALVARLGLTTDQMKKIEGIFDQRRQTIVQEKTSLESEEAALTRMLDADPMEPTRNVSAQIDKVVQARAQMERTYSNMTLEMRQVLTRDQWTQLQMDQPQVVTSPLQPAGARGGPARPAAPLRGRGTTP